MRLILLKIFPVLILILFASAGNNKANAQKLTKFSGDSTKFITELNTLFSNLNDAEEKQTKTQIRDFMQKCSVRTQNSGKK